MASTETPPDTTGTTDRRERGRARPPREPPTPAATAEGGGGRGDEDGLDVVLDLRDDATDADRTWPRRAPWTPTPHHPPPRRRPRGEPWPVPHRPPVGPGASDTGGGTRRPEDQEVEELGGAGGAAGVSPGAPDPEGR